jgi:enoyl-CoA hydratase
MSVRVETTDSVTTVIIDRPERRNAVDGPTAQALAEAFRAFESDGRARVGVLWGAGGTFCAGADLKDMSAGGGERQAWAGRIATEADLAWKALLRHYRPTKPLIAAVEGWAIAGGTEILQAIDIRVAGDTATFGISEVRRGLFPLGGSTVRLRRQIPYTIAAEMLLTGRHVSAKEALEIGLIGHVVPAGQALAKAREIALQIAENGPLAVQAVLRSLRETEGLSEIDGLARELAIGLPVFATKDAMEGPLAFAQKRKPVFRGE